MEMEKHNVCNMYVCTCIYHVLIDMKANASENITALYMITELRHDI